MKRITSLYMLLSVVVIMTEAQLPIKFDDQYKTIYPKELCKLALNNPNLILIDVRSPGEYHDTSQYNNLNMGRLKSAINIPIDTIQKNIAVLNPYRNKTLVFYCSHSQRSRRVSLLLSKNGFTNFYNLNGGMSHINQMTIDEFPCKNERLESNLTYSNLSSVEALDLIKYDPKLVILDVRPSAKFNSLDSLAENNIGRIKNAINIPYADLKPRLPELFNYKNQSILVYSQSGDGDAPKTAAELKNKGFYKVYLLLAGLNDLLTRPGSSSVLENLPPYHIISSSTALSLLKNNTQLTIYDTRPAIEFENKVTGHEYYKNLGNIKNAINLEEKNFGSNDYPADKNAIILVYGRGESYKLARKLCEDGYRNVYVLRNFYDFVSSAFNVEGSREALQYLVNHEGLY